MGFHPAARENVPQPKVGTQGRGRLGGGLRPLRPKSLPSMLAIFGVEIQAKLGG